MNNILGFSLFKAKKETDPSLKPPADWWQLHIGKVRESLRAAHPDWPADKLEEMSKKTLGKTWYDEMDRKDKKKAREAEGKKYGKAPVEKSIDVPKLTGLGGITLAKGVRKETYSAEQPETLKWNPAVIVSCYDKDGKFSGKEVHTLPMVLKAPDKYDDGTFWKLIQSLADQSWDNREKRIDGITDLAAELRARNDKRKKEIEKAKIDGAVPESSKGKSNWELQKEFHFGKSLPHYPFEIDMFASIADDEPEAIENDAV